MSFINWGGENPEQRAIRARLEQEALYEQAVRMSQARNSTQFGGAGSAGSQAPKTVTTQVCVAERDIFGGAIDFYRYDYSTGVKTPLVDSNRRPDLASLNILGETTDTVSGDIFIFGDTRAYTGIFRVSVDGDSLFWHDPVIGSIGERDSSFAWNERSSLVWRYDPSLRVPVEYAEFYINLMNPFSGQSEFVNSFQYSLDLSTPRIFTSQDPTKLWLLFAYPGVEPGRGETTQYSLFQIDPTVERNEPFLPEQGRVFTVPSISSFATADSSTGFFVYRVIGNRIDPVRILAIDSNGTEQHGQTVDFTPILMTDIL